MNLLKPTKFFKFTAVILAALLIFPLPPGFCAVSAYEDLPMPGTLLNRSPEYFAPALKGVRLDPHDPLKISFIVDSGTGKAINRQEAGVLVRYFLAGLTLPQDELWVNLSPYEQDRILTDHLASTDLGKDMLKDDYLLKQFAASLSDPQSQFGKNYWQNIRRTLAQKTGKTNQEIDSFCKVWIMPQQAEIYESGQSAVITAARLKVLVEEDYLAMQKNGVGANNHSPASQDAINRVSTSEIINVFRQQVVPLIENEVNNGKNFTRLRQIYSALILAVWFKDKFKQSFYKNYIDAAKIKGIDLDDPTVKAKIYTQYTDAFKKGVYDLVQRDRDPGSMRVFRRRYFSGGADFSGLGGVVTAEKKTSPWAGAGPARRITAIGMPVDLSIRVEPVRIEPQVVSFGQRMARPGSQRERAMGIDESTRRLYAYQAKFEAEIDRVPREGEEDVLRPVRLNKYGVDFVVVCAPEGAPMGDNAGYSFISTSQNEKYRGKVIIVVNRDLVLNPGYRDNVFGSLSNEIAFHYIRLTYWMRQGLSAPDAHVAAWYDQIARNDFKLTPLQRYSMATMTPQERRNIFEEYYHFRGRHDAIYATMYNKNWTRLNAARISGDQDLIRRVASEIIEIDLYAINRAEMKFWFMISGPLLGTQEHVPRGDVFKNLLAPGGDPNDTGQVAVQCRGIRRFWGDLLENTDKAKAELERRIDRDRRATVEVKAEDTVFTGGSSLVVSKPQEPGVVYKIARPWTNKTYDDRAYGLFTTNARIIYELRKQLDMEIKGVEGVSRVISIGVNPDGALFAKTTTLRGNPRVLYHSPYWQAMDRPRRLKVLKQIAEILQAIHAAGYIHVDIKPDNIIMNEFDEVMIIDVGNSLPFDKNKLMKKDDRDMLGTENYFPKGDKYYSPKMDVYALGMMAEELLYDMPDVYAEFEGLCDAMLSSVVYIAENGAVRDGGGRLTMAEVAQKIGEMIAGPAAASVPQGAQIGAMRAPSVYGGAEVSNFSRIKDNLPPGDWKNRPSAEQEEAFAEFVEKYIQDHQLLSAENIPFGQIEIAMDFGNGNLPGVNLKTGYGQVILINSNDGVSKDIRRQALTHERNEAMFLKGHRPGFSTIPYTQREAHILASAVDAHENKYRLTDFHRHWIAHASTDELNAIIQEYYLTRTLHYSLVNAEEHLANNPRLNADKFFDYQIQFWVTARQELRKRGVIDYLEGADADLWRRTVENYMPKEVPQVLSHIFLNGKRFQAGEFPAEITEQEQFSSGGYAYVTVKKNGRAVKVARPWGNPLENRGGNDLPVSNQILAKEIDMLIRLQNAGIEGVPKVIAAGIGRDGAMWYEMQTIANGQSLSDSPVWVNMTAAEKRDIMAKVAGILQKIHEAGYVHGDINPKNILINEDRKAMIIDMGTMVPAGGNSDIITRGYGRLEFQGRQADYDVSSLGRTCEELFSIREIRELGLSHLFEEMSDYDNPQPIKTMEEVIARLQGKPKPVALAEGETQGGIDFNRDSFNLKVTGKNSAQSGGQGALSPDYEGFTFRITALSERPASRTFAEFLQ